MASRRLRLLSLLAIASLAFGACSSTPKASAGASGGTACAATGTQGGANLQIPDIEAGKFNVSMVLVRPHHDGGWSPGPQRGPPDGSHKPSDKPAFAIP